jgi:divinyl chlorophyllide a 8-vinyl-reductase
MLVWDEVNNRYAAEATPSFGSDTLQQFHTKLVNGEAAVDLGEHAVF